MIYGTVGAKFEGKNDFVSTLGIGSIWGSFLSLSQLGSYWETFFTSLFSILLTGEIDSTAGDSLIL